MANDTATMLGQDNQVYDVPIDQVPQALSAGGRHVSLGASNNSVLMLGQDQQTYDVNLSDIPQALALGGSFLDKNSGTPYAAPIPTAPPTFRQLHPNWIGPEPRIDLSTDPVGKEYLGIEAANKVGRQGFVESFGKILSPDALPFAGAAKQAIDVGKVLLTAKTLVDDGTPPEKDLLELNLFLAEQDRDANSTILGTTGSIIRMLPAFGLEIAAVSAGAALTPWAGGAGGWAALGARMEAGGVFKLAKAGVEAAIKKYVLKHAADNVARPFLVKVAGNMAYAATAGALNTAVSQTVQGIATTAAGQDVGSLAANTRALYNTLGANDESYWKSYVMGTISNMIETGTEFTGTPMANMVGGVLKHIPLSAKWAETYAARLAQGSKSWLELKVGPALAEREMVKALKLGGAAKVVMDLADKWVVPYDVAMKRLKKMGYDGVLEEMGEERLGGFLHGLFGTQGDEASLRNAWDQMIPTTDQAWAEVLGFSFPMIGAKAAEVSKSMLRGVTNSNFDTNQAAVAQASKPRTKVVDGKVVDDAVIVEAEKDRIVTQAVDGIEQASSLDQGVNKYLDFVFDLVTVPFTLNFSQLRLGSFDRAYASTNGKAYVQAYRKILEEQTAAHPENPELARKVARTAMAMEFEGNLASVSVATQEDAKFADELTTQGIINVVRGKNVQNTPAFQVLNIGGFLVHGERAKRLSSLLGKYGVPVQVSALDPALTAANTMSVPAKEELKRMVSMKPEEYLALIDSVESDPAAAFTVAARMGMNPNLAMSPNFPEAMKLWLASRRAFITSHVNGPVQVNTPLRQKATGTILYVTGIRGTGIVDVLDPKTGARDAIAMAKIGEQDDSEYRRPEWNIVMHAPVQVTRTEAEMHAYLEASGYRGDIDAEIKAREHTVRKSDNAKIYLSQEAGVNFETERSSPEEFVANIYLDVTMGPYHLAEEASESGTSGMDPKGRRILPKSLDAGMAVLRQYVSAQIAADAEGKWRELDLQLSTPRGQFEFFHKYMLQRHAAYEFMYTDTMDPTMAYSTLPMTDLIALVPRNLEETGDAMAFTSWDTHMNIVLGPGWQTLYRNPLVAQLLPLDINKAAERLDAIKHAVVPPEDQPVVVPSEENQSVASKLGLDVEPASAGSDKSEAASEEKPNTSELGLMKAQAAVDAYATVRPITMVRESITLIEKYPNTYKTLLDAALAVRAKRLAAARANQGEGSPKPGKSAEPIGVAVAPTPEDLANPAYRDAYEQAKSTGMSEEAAMAAGRGAVARSNEPKTEGQLNQEKGLPPASARQGAVVEAAVPAKKPVKKKPIQTRNLNDMLAEAGSPVDANVGRTQAELNLQGNLAAKQEAEAARRAVPLTPETVAQDFFYGGDEKRPGRGYLVELITGQELYMARKDSPKGRTWAAYTVDGEPTGDQAGTKSELLQKLQQRNVPPGVDVAPSLSAGAQKRLSETMAGLHDVSKVYDRYKFYHNKWSLHYDLPPLLDKEAFFKKVRVSKKWRDVYFGRVVYGDDQTERLEQNATGSDEDPEDGSDVDMSELGIRDFLEDSGAKFTELSQMTSMWRVPAIIQAFTALSGRDGFNEWTRVAGKWQENMLREFRAGDVTKIQPHLASEKAYTAWTRAATADGAETLLRTMMGAFNLESAASVYSNFQSTSRRTLLLARKSQNKATGAITTAFVPLNAREATAEFKAPINETLNQWVKNAVEAAKDDRTEGNPDDVTFKYNRAMRALQKEVLNRLQGLRAREADINGSAWLEAGLNQDADVDAKGMGKGHESHNLRVTWTANVPSESIVANPHSRRAIADLAIGLMSNGVNDDRVKALWDYVVDNPTAKVNNDALSWFWKSIQYNLFANTSLPNMGKKQEAMSEARFNEIIAGWKDRLESSVYDHLALQQHPETAGFANSGISAKKARLSSISYGSPQERQLISERLDNPESVWTNATFTEIVGTHDTTTQKNNKDAEELASADRVMLLRQFFQTNPGSIFIPFNMGEKGALKGVVVPLREGMTSFTDNWNFYKPKLDSLILGTPSEWKDMLSYNTRAAATATNGLTPVLTAGGLPAFSRMLVINDSTTRTWAEWNKLYPDWIPAPTAGEATEKFALNDGGTWVSEATALAMDRSFGFSQDNWKVGFFGRSGGKTLINKGNISIARDSGGIQSVMAAWFARLNEGLDVKDPSYIHFITSSETAKKHSGTVIDIKPDISRSDAVAASVQVPLITMYFQSQLDSDDRLKLGTWVTQFFSNFNNVKNPEPLYQMLQTAMQKQYASLLEQEKKGGLKAKTVINDEIEEIKWLFTSTGVSDQYPWGTPVLDMARAAAIGDWLQPLFPMRRGSARSGAGIKGVYDSVLHEGQGLQLPTIQAQAFDHKGNRAGRYARDWAYVGAKGDAVALRKVTVDHIAEKLNDPYTFSMYADMIKDGSRAKGRVYTGADIRDWEIRITNLAKGEVMIPGSMVMVARTPGLGIGSSYILGRLSYEPLADIGNGVHMHPVTMRRTSADFDGDTWHVYFFDPSAGMPKGDPLTDSYTSQMNAIMTDVILPNYDSMPKDVLQAELSATHFNKDVPSEYGTALQKKMDAQMDALTMDKGKRVEWYSIETYEKLLDLYRDARKLLGILVSTNGGSLLTFGSGRMGVQNADNTPIPVYTKYKSYMSTDPRTGKPTQLQLSMYRPAMKDLPADRKRADQLISMTIDDVVQLVLDNKKHPQHKAMGLIADNASMYVTLMRTGVLTALDGTIIPITSRAQADILHEMVLEFLSQGIFEPFYADKAQARRIVHTPPMTGTAVSAKMVERGTEIGIREKSSPANAVAYARDQVANFNMVKTVAQRSFDAFAAARFGVKSNTITRDQWVRHNNFFKGVRGETIDGRKGAKLEYVDQGPPTFDMAQYGLEARARMVWSSEKATSFVPPHWYSTPFGAALEEAFLWEYAYDTGARKQPGIAPSAFTLERTTRASFDSNGVAIPIGQPARAWRPGAFPGAAVNAVIAARAINHARPDLHVMNLMFSPWTLTKGNHGAPLITRAIRELKSREDMQGNIAAQAMKALEGTEQTSPKAPDSAEQDEYRAFFGVEMTPDSGTNVDLLRAAMEEIRMLPAFGGFNSGNDFLLALASVSVFQDGVSMGADNKANRNAMPFMPASIHNQLGVMMDAEYQYWKSNAPTEVERDQIMRFLKGAEWNYMPPVVASAAPAMIGTPAVDEGPIMSSAELEAKMGFGDESTIDELLDKSAEGGMSDAELAAQLAQDSEAADTRREQTPEQEAPTPAVTPEAQVPVAQEQKPSTFDLTHVYYRSGAVRPGKSAYYTDDRKFLADMSLGGPGVTAIVLAKNFKWVPIDADTTPGYPYHTNEATLTEAKIAEYVAAGYDGIKGVGYPEDRDEIVVFNQNKIMVVPEQAPVAQAPSPNLVSPQAQASVAQAPAPYKALYPDLARLGMKGFNGRTLMDMLDGARRDARSQADFENRELNLWNQWASHNPNAYAELVLGTKSPGYRESVQSLARSLVARGIPIPTKRPGAAAMERGSYSTPGTAGGFLGAATFNAGTISAVNTAERDRIQSETSIQKLQGMLEYKERKITEESSSPQPSQQLISAMSQEANWMRRRLAELQAPVDVAEVQAAVAELGSPALQELVRGQDTLEGKALDAVLDRLTASDWEFISVFVGAGTNRENFSKRIDAVIAALPKIEAAMQLPSNSVTPQAQAPMMTAPMPDNFNVPIDDEEGMSEVIQYDRDPSTNVWTRTWPVEDGSPPEDVSETVVRAAWQKLNRKTPPTPDVAPSIAPATARASFYRDGSLDPIAVLNKAAQVMSGRPVGEFLKAAIANGVRLPARIDVRSTQVLAENERYSFVGRAHPEDNSIEFSQQAFDVDEAKFARMLAHEWVHLLTVDAIARPGDYQDRMVELYIAARDAALASDDPAIKRAYGLTRNVRDFVAEAFSDPQLQRFLASIPTTSAPNAPTLWQQFVNTVHTIVRSVFPQATQNNALEELLSLTLAEIVPAEPTVTEVETPLSITALAKTAESPLFIELPPEVQDAVDVAPSITFIDINKFRYRTPYVNGASVQHLALQREFLRMMKFRQDVSDIYKRVYRELAADQSGDIRDLKTNKIVGKMSDYDRDVIKQFLWLITALKEDPRVTQVLRAKDTNGQPVSDDVKRKKIEMLMESRVDLSAKVEGTVVPGIEATWGHDMVDADGRKVSGPQELVKDALARVMASPAVAKLTSAGRTTTEHLDWYKHLVTMNDVFQSVIDEYKGVVPEWVGYAGQHAYGVGFKDSRIRDAEDAVHKGRIKAKGAQADRTHLPNGDKVEYALSLSADTATALTTDQKNLLREMLSAEEFEDTKDLTIWSANALIKTELERRQIDKAWRDGKAYDAQSPENSKDINTIARLTATLASYRHKEWTARIWNRRHRGSFADIYKSTDKGDGEKPPLRPATMDYLSMMKDYIDGALPALVNKVILKEFVADQGMNVIAIPSETALTSRDAEKRSLLSKEDYMGMAQTMALARKQYVDPKADLRSQILYLAASLPITEYEIMESPFPSISKFYVRKGDHVAVMKHITSKDLKWYVGGYDVLTTLSHITQWSKITSVGYSLFFPWTLGESLVAGTGTWKVVDGKPKWTNVWTLNPKDIKDNIQSISKVWSELRAHDAGIHKWLSMLASVGVSLEANVVTDEAFGEVQTDIERAAKHWDLLHPGQGAWVKKSLDLFTGRGASELWFGKPGTRPGMFTAAKLWAVQREAYAVAEAEGSSWETMPESEQLRILKMIAPAMNKAYGGAFWQSYMWANPRTLKILNLGIFAPQWTLMAAEIAGLDLIMGRFMGSSSSPYERKFILRNWIAMGGLVMLAIPAAMQASIFALFGGGGGAPDDHPFPWQNEEGRESYVDITPLARLSPFYKGDPTGRRRAYMRWGKQAYEVIDGWLTEPGAQFMRKLSQPAKWVWEQGTGTSPGSDWNLDFQGQGLMGFLKTEKEGAEGFWGSRVGMTAQKFVPMSILTAVKNPETGLAAFIAPLSKGMSAGKATAELVKVFNTYADDTQWGKIRTMPKARSVLEGLAPGLLDAARRNGYDTDKIVDSAKGVVLGRLYKNFFAALDETDTKLMDHISQQILRVGGTAQGLYSSVKGRDKAYGKETTAEEKAAIYAALNEVVPPTPEEKKAVQKSVTAEKQALKAEARVQKVLDAAGTVKAKRPTGLLRVGNTNDTTDSVEIYQAVKGGPQIVIPVVKAGTDIILDREAAILQFKASGKHLGMFDTLAHAQAFVNG